MKNMKIATLNMNGETWFSINRRPRLPESIFSIKEIKEKLTSLTEEGLKRILKSEELDIIAVQEVVNSANERERIEKVIDKAGYTFIAPKVGGNVHFVTGFIVKKSLEVNCQLKKVEECLPAEVLKDLCLPTNNRKALLEYGKAGDNNFFRILNIHVKDKKIDIPKFGKNTILIGDFNACKSDQTSNAKAINKEILDKIEENYTSVDQKGNYTWKSNNIEKQLDHIYISKGSETGFFGKIKEEKDDSVNFYYDEQNGFTDHSMLILEWGWNQENKEG